MLNLMIIICFSVLFLAINCFEASLQNVRPFIEVKLTASSLLQLLPKPNLTASWWARLSPSPLALTSSWMVLWVVNQSLLCTGQRERRFWSLERNTLLPTLQLEPWPWSRTVTDMIQADTFWLSRMPAESRPPLSTSKFWVSCQETSIIFVS